MNNDINYFAQLNYRNRQDKFGIKLDDRRRHMYIIGKTGMGKTVMLQNMAIQDILAGNGVGIVDPHGDFAEALLDFIPKERINDVVYFNPADYDFPIGLNLLEDVGYDRRHLVASGLMGVFKKIWVDVWSARMEYILNNAILALLEYPDATLLDVNRMLANKDFRRKVLEHVEDPIVKSFWTQEFAKYTERLASEATASIENKVGQFTAAPLIRNIIGQKDSTVDLREMMDSKKIFILNLSKGRIGEDNSRLLGAMVITKLYLAAMSRVDTPEEERQDFTLYVDEFQNFASEAFEGILSEARKYRLSLVLAHQYIAQMDEVVRDAVFGNVGTLLTFRIGADDAEFIEKEFAPAFTMEDLINLPKYNILLKLMIDGVTSRAFSAHTLAPILPQEESHREEVIESSRRQYATPREDIEKVIRQWSEGNEGAQKSNNSNNSGQRFSSPQFQEPPQLYDAVCAQCEKDTKVTFEPDGKRPIYCKKCRTKRDRERAERAEAQRSRSPQAASSRPSFINLNDARRAHPAPATPPQTDRTSVASSPPQRTSPDDKKGSPSPPSRALGNGEDPKIKKKEVDLGGLRELLKETGGIDREAKGNR